MSTSPQRFLTGLLATLLLAALVTPAAAHRAPSDASQSSPTPDSVDLVVRPAPGVGVQSAAAGAQHVATALDGPATLRAVHERSGVAVVSVAGGEVERAMHVLAAEPHIDDVEIDPVVEAFDVAPASLLDGDRPNDERYSGQWALPHVDAPGAWAHTTGSASVRVAVLDTGVDGSHEDLDVADGVNLSGSGDTDDHGDRHGHGTHVAGIAAATTDNMRGVAGTCWTCELLSVKVLSDSGSGTQSQVAEGIHWAIEADADVVVMSLGGPGSSSTLARAVEAADDAGVTMVAAAGNHASDDAYHPAAYDEVIGVGAVSDRDERASFSNHGDWVEIAAPGVGIDSTIAQPNEMGCSSDYCARSGTSMATPLVGGVAALARSLDPQPDAAAIRSALADHAVDVGDWLTEGRVDAEATLAALADADHGEEDDDDEQGDDAGGRDDSGDDEGDDDAGDDSDDGGSDDGDSDDGGSDDGDSDDGDSDDGDSDDGDSDDGSGGGHRLDDGVTRTAGSQRFATAARLSADTFEPGVERAYLATGTRFADALAAGAAAGAAHGPVLLATSTALPGDTADELARLEPDEVVVVGGAGAISDEVRSAAEAAADAPSRRLAGPERFATAAEIALDAFEPGGDVAFVATGGDFADALAGVPAAVVEHGPMLLTATDELPEATRGALARLRPDEIVTLGGTGAVSASVEADLRALAGNKGVTRVAGSTRFATASAIAERFDEAPGSFLATGVDFPDALAGGPVAGHYASPLLLVAGDDAPAETRTQLDRLSPRHLRLLGGSSVISDELFDNLRLSHER